MVLLLIPNKILLKMPSFKFNHQKVQSGPSSARRFLSGDDAKFDFQNRSNKIQLRSICNQDTNLNFEKRVDQN